MTRVAVRPELLRWARERARMEPADLTGRFPKLPEWEAQELQPTLKQLEDYAHATHAPIGYFFLAEPPQEPLPIPDFRTLAGRTVTRPSPNLLDMIYVCQERQAWYRDFATVGGQTPLDFIGSFTPQTPPEQAATTMRLRLGFSVEERRECSSWEEALRRFIEQADRIGVLVMVSGVVMNNNTRKLDPEEFRGFALADSLAPLVFINGADSKSAQMFTLAHELAHLWLGASALSDASAGSAPDDVTERWCNQVAAELLITGRLNGIEFTEATADEKRRRGQPGQAGCNCDRTILSRVGRRFCSALVAAALEGNTLYRDAFRMLGIARSAEFDEMGRSLGFCV